MCLSAEADLIGGAAITIIGIDCLRHLSHRREWALAALPVLLGTHQLIEAVVWLSLEGHLSEPAGHLAMWLYLVIAFTVVPACVPLAVMAFEPHPARRRAMMPFAALGIAIAALLLSALVRGPISASLAPYHLNYRVPVTHGALVVALYVVATCGTVVLSTQPSVRAFGEVNLAVVAVLAWMERNGFASLWCAWAALSSLALAMFLRRSAVHDTTLLGVR